ncbi:MAG TPA: hypothetical protein EYO59_04860 [Chromatiaceae bacterium]|nr:hypothetical protein [Chromatiaceae bacterium]
MTIAEVESRARLLYFLENNLTVTASPAGSDTYIQFNDDGSMGGDANLTWDASTLAVGGALTITGNTTLGDTSGDTVTINGITAGTDNSVVVIDGSGVLKHDEIDSKVWAAKLIDYTGTPANNELAVWTDTDTVEGDSNLTWDGSLFKMVQDPTGLSGDTGAGEVVTFGTEDVTDTLAAGRLMYLNNSGVWKYADGDAASTGGSQLLAIALGTAVSDGLLLRGFFDMATYFQGTFDQGVPLYVSTTAGSVDVAAPSATGDFVRVVGYCTDTANVIYFNPDGTYIEIS